MDFRKMAAGLVLLLAALLCLTAAAAAEEAPDITRECVFQVCSSSRSYRQMTDGKYTTFWESRKIKHPYVIISSETPMYGVYLCFRKMPSSFEIQTRQDEEEEWRTVAEGDTRFQHTFYALDGLNCIRIRSTQENTIQMGFNELFVFGQGEIPDWVQRWEETEKKADVMFLIAHPDDELLFTGGAIPTYDTEMGRRVVVVYLSWSSATRRSEALNGLWHMGVRNYPVCGNFSDRYSSKAKAAYEKLGKKKVLGWITELFRKYRPDAVVTHDTEGEYGHGQHRMMADACIQGYTLAADPEMYPESAGQWGAWQVKKLYLHLYGPEEDRTRFDWNTPLAAFGGKTGLELATEAYAMHVTQENAKVKINHQWHVLSVEETGTVFDNTWFGLYASEVGPDETHTDFLEHVETAEEEDWIPLS